MASFNRIIMMGNLTRDPEYRQLSAGQNVCRLGLASNRQFKNRQTGAMVQEVCFVDIDVWGPQADSCNQYLAKGRQILVEGRLKLDSWQDNDGNKRSKHYIVADRVTFLTANQSEGFDQQEGSTAGFGSEMSDPAVKQAVEKATKVKKAKATGGELDFKDEAPFEDDLPF